MSPPKFKVGDRVKWKDSDGCDRSGAVHGYDKSSQRYPVTESDFIVATWWHESHLSLDVPAEPKFKIGDRVKWADNYGNQRRGSVSGKTFNECYSVKEAQELKPGLWHESSLSLDVPEPKQFATKLEAELGAEITRLNFQIIDQRKENVFTVSRMAAEIGNVHRERFAKETAQKELVEANDKIKRLKSLIGEM